MPALPRPGSLLALAVALCALPALAQDLQTGNDWAVGSAQSAVVDSINRENVKRLRRRPGGPPAVARPTPRRWSATERARNCALLKAHLHRLNARQLRDYRAACG